MLILRRTLLILLLPFFCFLLFVAAVDFGLVRTVTQPGQIKKTAAASGIYSQVIPDVLSQAQNISGDSGNIPLSDPAVKAAANQAFSPAFVQQSTAQAIDSIYNWLNGKTAQPDFKIDLSAQKSQFAALVGRAAEAKAKSLPACTTPLDLSSYNVFSANCLPKGLSASEIGASAQGIIQNGQGFLDNPVISADTIKSSGSNSSIFSKQLKPVPKYFKWIKVSPLVLAGLAILSGVAIYFLAHSRRAGIKYLAICFLVVGVITLVFAEAVAYVVHAQVPKINFGQSSLNGGIRSIITKLAQAVDKNYWWLGSFYSALGAGIIIWLVRSRKPAYKTQKPTQREFEDLPVTPKKP